MIGLYQINELHHALPLSFSKFLPAFLSQALQTLEHYAQAVVTNPSHSFQVHQEEIVIRSILFIINVLSCPQYRPGGKNKNSGQETSSSSKPLPTCTEIEEEDDDDDDDDDDEAEEDEDEDEDEEMEMEMKRMREMAMGDGDGNGGQ
ncbi:hypothetical protein GUITHDRAFT_117449 [Guillardia theta CCMP2712]|uniref:Uncharacterized protein n=1 Tax=Guillardia theta (strain CCMP2712) TaxID=905079 RepID=L1IKA5_GUITC|nr:hypothetical protein GUITHDRAFT_117449 [Guillardia theta CCMP2712]EKX36339.1 hypothetical protein GUITHDRAFT_117449 [Guillardia theta CCMP2712]|eukprot:XP_005823319.1 hypothetical protein GUITHDRAFT_117449 [Guillardia theta CCMP2712]